MLTDPEQLRADLDEAGLAVCSVHAKIIDGDGEAMAARRPRPSARAP